MKFEYDKDEVVLVGEFEDDFTFSHEFKGISYFVAHMRIPRRNGVIDSLPIIRRFNAGDNHAVAGKRYRIEGQFRTFSARLMPDNLPGFFITVYSMEESNEPDLNKAEIIGTAMREPRFSKSGASALLPLKITSGDGNGKYWRIQALLWRDYHKKLANSIREGDVIRVVGRIQSRQYHKQIQPGYDDTYTVYDVVADEMEVEE